MKKSALLLSITVIILAAVISAATVYQNIAATISFSKESESRSAAVRININTATVDELAFIPGIGEELAKKIVAFRVENGPFNSVQELLLINGIGPKTFDKIADYLTVGG